MRRLTILIICWLLPTGAWLLGSPPARADAPPSQGRREVSVDTEIDRLLADLDSDRYALRQRAASRLEELATEAEMAAVLAKRFELVLVMPDTSLEVRKQLERLLRWLPQTPLPPAEQVSDAEIDRLVRQLDDDAYSARLAAGKRLEWLLDNPKLAYAVMVRLKQGLAAKPVPAGSQEALQALYQHAHGAWLASDPKSWRLPPVSPAQIGRWIDDLIASGAANAGEGKRLAAEAALRELREVLARDAEVAKVKAALDARLADKNLAPASAARLGELVELTRPPTMVAEYWEGRRHLNTQHLVIGVPSQSAGAQRPSHFDRIDDRTAHCVSGQNLSPGDHPVGVAIPHPKREGALFHLVNLSMPRLRMAYAHQSRRTEAARLAAISRRTLDRYLARKTPLSDRELALLEQLDSVEVSRFAGRFFQAVDDQPMPGEPENPWWPRTSRHGALCMVLAVVGTREAIPGLLKAVEGRRFLAPTAAAPYQLPWIAALAIAVRAPWAEVDGWLANLSERAEPLLLGSADSPEVGATAAAILLRRQRQAPTAFGLKPAPNETLQMLGLSGYRFASPESRSKVRQWWEGRKKTP